MISIWEQESLLSYDVIIIGAGITGLSTAASLKEKQPGLSILILEKGKLPMGASTRNAGFACFGSISELQGDIRQLGEDGMCRLVEQRWKGLEKTKRRLGASNIGFEPCGGYELYRDIDAFNPDTVNRINRLLKDVVGDQVFKQYDEGIRDFGFNKVEHLIFNRFEGALNTGKLIAALWDYCQKAGVRILTGTEVKSIKPGNQSALAETGDYRFEGKAIGICTNAFSKTLLKDIDLKPGRGSVMVVNPKKSPAFRGTFHYDQGYFYFRNFGDKIIFGGGRNLDPETESTLEFGINPRIRNKLIHDLETMIIPGQPYSIDIEWSGIMAFGETKAPIVKKIDEYTFAGVRLGGMGIAIGSMVGEELAELILRARF